jgi:hypothetical protein
MVGALSLIAAGCGVLTAAFNAPKQQETCIYRLEAAANPFGFQERCDMLGLSYTRLPHW